MAAPIIVNGSPPDALLSDYPGYTGPLETVQDLVARGNVEASSRRKYQSEIKAIREHKAATLANTPLPVAK